MQVAAGSTSGDATVPKKKSVSDFELGEQIGEGSYSTVQICQLVRFVLIIYQKVIHAIEKTTKREYAIKVLDKRHIVREKKVKYVNIEKEVLNRLNHPLIVKLYYTFQDTSSLCKYYYCCTKDRQCNVPLLDFVLDYAKNGDLCQYLRKVCKLLWLRSS